MHVYKKKKKKRLQLTQTIRYCMYRCIYRKTRNLKKRKMRQPKKKTVCLCSFAAKKYKKNVCWGFTTVEYFVKTKFNWKRVWRTLKVICSLTIGKQKKRKRVKTRGTAYVYCSAVVETTERNTSFINNNKMLFTGRCDCLKNLLKKNAYTNTLRFCRRPSGK